jgi:magnesium transporter
MSPPPPEEDVHVNTIHTRAWRDGKVIADDFPLSELDGWLAKKDTLVWADLCAADTDVLSQLADELGLSPLAVEDAITEGERVKLARHPGHLFITCYGTTIDVDKNPDHKSRLITSQVSIFVMPQGLVTVRRDENFDIATVMKHWDDDGDLLSQGVFALLHGLLDEVVDSHFEAVQHLDDAIEDVEAMLFENGSLLGRQEGIYRLRREVVELRRVVLPMREVVLSINRRRESHPENGNGDENGSKQSTTPSMTGTTLDGWYDDLYDHSLRAAEWTESLRDMISSLFETNLSLQDARLNTIMKKLAGWAAIIAVPTAITGWFGQNVPYTGFGQPFGVALSLALILGGSIALYLVFRKYDWI